MDYLTFREPVFAFPKPCKNKAKSNAFPLSLHKLRAIRLCSRLWILCCLRTSGMLANPMDYLTFREPGFAFTNPCKTKQNSMHFRSVGINGERFAFVLGCGFYAGQHLENVSWSHGKLDVLLTHKSVHETMQIISSFQPPLAG